MIRFAACVICLAAATAATADFFDQADVVFLGEQHDNPAHHARQAELVADIGPTVLVFEMLTQAQAAAATPDLIADQDALEAALGWADSGWPDFAMYYPIFAAAPDAAVAGSAVPRTRTREAMTRPIPDLFGPDAARFGLTTPLPEDQQQTREALQLAVHCDAMPAEMLPVMVSIQRWRDAEIARAALKAFEIHGGPVVVITGNGHARADWGAPAALLNAAPGMRVASLGQGETSTGAPTGMFDHVEIGPDVDRGDPCDAFR